MRILIIADTKIKDEELDELQRDFIDLVYTHTGITPDFYIEGRKWAGYRTEVDSDGDIRIHPQILLEVEEDVHKRYLDYGVDHIVLLIHEDNWKSDGPDWKGIWGTAYAYLNSNFLIEYCRFDRDNMANSVGTLYHEHCHPLDALIRVELGIDINPIMESKIRGEYPNNQRVIKYLDKYGFNWDRDFVHGGRSLGGHPIYAYINYKQNTEILEWASPYLKQAYKKRQEKAGKQNIQKKIVSLLEEVIRAYRKLIYYKNGVPRD